MKHDYENKMMGSNDPDYEAKDIVKVCIEKDCGNEFIFSADEQAYFKEMKYVQPVRCLNCRRQRRLAKLKDARN